MSELERFAASAVMCAGRVSGLMACSPVFSTGAIASPVKAALALTFAVLVYPAYVANAVALADNRSVMTATVAEFAIGAVVGLGARLVFEGVQLAGQVMGLQMGLSLATVFDPSSNADSPVMSTFVQMLAVLMFLALNAHVFLLRAIASSYTWLPPGAEFRWSAVAEWATKLVGAVLTTGVQVAAPVVLATISVDLVLGLLGKASPQLPVLLVGISVKAVVALLVLSLGLRYWPDLISRHFDTAFTATERLLHVVH